MFKNIFYKFLRELVEYFQKRGSCTKLIYTFKYFDNRLNFIAECFLS